MPKQLALIDRSADRKYFTIIPNFIWNMNLTTVAFRLYATIKKITGDNGTCFMGTRRLAQEAGISAGSVSAAKEQLESAGLISIVRRKRSSSGHPIDHVQVTDIWPQNMEHFAKRSADEPNRSAHEPKCSADELKCSGDETEEEHEEEQGRNDVDDLNQSYQQSLHALTGFGVDPCVADNLARRREQQHISAWITYAKSATRLTDPPAFIVRRLLDNQPVPNPSKPKRNRRQIARTATCHGPHCYRVVYADTLCPTCGLCPNCCDCDDQQGPENT